MKNGTPTPETLAKDLKSLQGYSDFQDFEFKASRNVNEASALSGAVMIHLPGEVPRLFDTSSAAVAFIEARIDAQDAAKNAEMSLGDIK